MPTALITGITGQDGTYLARHLLERGYEVHGLVRRSVSEPDHGLAGSGLVHLHYGDMTDAAGLIRIVQETDPDEIYNLAGQSHVRISFDTPEYTANADALGALRLLEAIRILNRRDKTRFYQASSSELFGNAPAPQSEATPFAPCSPYAAAKLYAYWVTVNYRQAYGIHASNGILFNHESPLRGEEFVTRKITRGVAAIEAGLQDRITLGNLNARRDWGHARDYVRGMHMMLQQDSPDDYVLATGESHSVRVFAETAFAEAGMPIEWAGSGMDETAYCRSTGRALIALDPDCLRPTEIDGLRGDASRARDKLGWVPETGFSALVREMVQADRLELGRNHNYRLEDRVA